MIALSYDMGSDLILASCSVAFVECMLTTSISCFVSDSAFIFKTETVFSNSISFCETRFEREDCSSADFLCSSMDAMLLSDVIAFAFEVCAFDGDGFCL